MWLDAILYLGVGKEHYYNQQNGGEISPGKLLRGGPCDPVGVDIFATCKEKYGICVRRSEEGYLGKLFASPLLRKIEISPIYRRNFKYNASQ